MGRYSGKKCRLVSMFGLTTAFFLVEIIVGYVTNSMALVADSFHMLSDIAALVIAFLSVRMAPKSWDKNTYGWARAEVLGALVNAVFLVALCFSITVESLKRFYEPEEIHNPQMILYVGAMGLAVNLLGLCLFHEHGHSHGGGGHSHGTVHHAGAHSHLAMMADDQDLDENGVPILKTMEEGRMGMGVVDTTADVNKNKDKNGHLHGHGHSHGGGGPHSAANMNMRGVFLHVLADALGSVVVIISALIMWLTEWEYKYYVDPALSMVLVILMMKSVWPLLIESALILLQTVPTHIEVDTLKRKLLENIDGVLAVHEFHVWQLTGDRIIASAHIRCLNLSEYMKVAENVKKFFHNEGIHSTTIQPEFLDYHPGKEYLIDEDCMLSCPITNKEGNANCESSKCCRQTKSTANTPVLERRSSQLETNHQLYNGDPNSEGPKNMVTSTPSRRSAPNLSDIVSPHMNQDNNSVGLTDISGVDPLEFNRRSSKKENPEVTTELNLSDIQLSSENESLETTPMFITPRSNSRVVRIISKQSNV